MLPKLSIQPVLAVKLLSWRCTAIQLDKVGSAVATLLSIRSTLQHPVVVKTEKKCNMYGNSKHAHMSVCNPFPIPIRCSISMARLRLYYVRVHLVIAFSLITSDRNTPEQ